ncbi:MAG: hypothetical protein P8186_14230, partial [Anaerolineae bacterium]
KDQDGIPDLKEPAMGFDPTKRGETGTTGDQWYNQDRRQQDKKCFGFHFYPSFPFLFMRYARFKNRMFVDLGTQSITQFSFEERHKFLCIMDSGAGRLVIQTIIRHAKIGKPVPGHRMES